MNQSRKRLQRALSAMFAKKQDKPELVPAVLGAYFNGQKTIVVAGREDFVYCRLRSATSERIQAFNDVVSHHWDLPVLIYRDPDVPDVWKVWGRDVAKYGEEWGGFSYMRPHGRSHSFSGDQGADPVWIEKRQYVPLLTHPAPTGTLALEIESGFYYHSARYHWWPGSGTTDLDAFKPTGAANGLFLTVYLDIETGNPAYLSGPEFNAAYPPKDPSDYISIPDFDVGIPLVAAFLQTGTSSIGWGELYDLRLPEHPPPGTGTFSPTDLPSPVIGVMNWDDGVPVGTGTTIDWGRELDISLSGSVLRVDANVVHPAPQLGVMNWDDGVPLGTGTTIDWGDELTASLSGSVLRVDASGGDPAVTGSVGDWSVYYEFHTGTVIKEHHLSFDSVTGSMVTELRCAEFDADNVNANPRVNAMRLNGLLVTIWSVANPLKWWMGRVEGDAGGDQVSSVVLPVAHLIHSGGETPFDEDERIVLTAAFMQISTGTVDIYNDGVFQTKAWALDFGDNLDTTVSGGYVTIDGQAGGGGGGGGLGVVVWDDGVFLATGTILDFGDNLDLTVSGSVIRIDAQAAGSGTVSNFLDLDDTPASYSGQSGTVLAVNESEDAVEFVSRAPGALKFWQYNEGATDIGTVSAVLVDMTDMIITGTFDADDILEVHYSTGVGHSVTNGVTEFVIAIDGSPVTTEPGVRTPVVSVGPANHLHYMAKMTAGTKVISGQWKTSSGGTAHNRATSLEHRQLSVKIFQG